MFHLFWIVAQAPSLPEAPKGWDTWSSDTALIFMAVTGFVTLIGMAAFFARENTKMLGTVSQIQKDMAEAEAKRSEENSVQSRKWRAYHRQQTEKVIQQITEKMDERHTDLVKTITTALTGAKGGRQQTGN